MGIFYCAGTIIFEHESLARQIFAWGFRVCGYYRVLVFRARICRAVTTRVGINVLETSCSMVLNPFRDKRIIQLRFVVTV